MRITSQNIKSWIFRQPGQPFKARCNCKTPVNKYDGTTGSRNITLDLKHEIGKPAICLLYLLLFTFCLLLTK